MLPIDALGIPPRRRRAEDAARRITAWPIIRCSPRPRAAASARSSGHVESTDVTNDVNGGPSGVGIATAAGKAAFWDIVGAPMGAPKVIAFEGEFAMTEGHAQELKTQALALQGRQAAARSCSPTTTPASTIRCIGGVIDTQVRRLST